MRREWRNERGWHVEMLSISKAATVFVGQASKAPRVFIRFDAAYYPDDYTERAELAAEALAEFGQATEVTA